MLTRETLIEKKKYSEQMVEKWGDAHKVKLQEYLTPEELFLLNSSINSLKGSLRAIISR